MDPEIRQKIVELLELTRQNNEILTGMRRTQRWATFFNLIYWAIIVGSLIGAFYFFQPYIDQIKSLVSSLPSAAQIQTIFGQVKGK